MLSIMCTVNIEKKKKKRHYDFSDVEETFDGIHLHVYTPARLPTIRRRDVRNNSTRYQGFFTDTVYDKTIIVNCEFLEFRNIQQ